VKRPVRLGIDVGGLGFTRSGVDRYLWNMIANLAARDTDIEFLFYCQRPVRIPLPLGKWSLRVDDSYQWMPHFVWLQKRCPQLLARDHVAVFWGQNHLLPLSLRAPCLRLLTVHDVTAALYPRTAAKRSRLPSRLYFRRAVHAADIVVVDSRATARLAQLCLGADASRMCVVYPGLPNGLGFVKHAREFVADRFGLSSGFLLTVGNIEPRKEHLLLLSALEEVPGRPVLAIVGSPSWRSRRILNEIARHEKAGWVRFLGRVEDAELARLYSAARLMVYPSFYEGFGLPVLEAMACGCPVLCSWSSSLPEVGGSAARYFRPRDVNSLTHSLRMLLRDERLLAEMRNLGLERSARFSYEQAARQLVDLLREVLRLN